MLNFDTKIIANILRKISIVHEGEELDFIAVNDKDEFINPREGITDDEINKYFPSFIFARKNPTEHEGTVREVFILNKKQVLDKIPTMYLFQEV